MRVHKSSSERRLSSTTNPSGKSSAADTQRPSQPSSEEVPQPPPPQPQPTDEDLERADSPSHFVTPKMRFESLKMYLECSSHKVLVDRQRQKHFFDHVLSLVLVIGMCVFLAFLIWIILFMKMKVQTLADLEELKEGQAPSVFF